MSVAPASLEQALRTRFGDEIVLRGVPPLYLSDATEARGLRGSADAVVLPRRAEEVADVVAWCYEHGAPLTPRGGGTGFAGGAVPLGGVVLGLERLAAVRSLDPELWRMEVEAGVTTLDVRRRARESGLLFPPDPGAAEQSQIGGNVATNAGGPHAFKYGVTGDWVTGVEAVVAPGELVRVGGAIRKDVAGYDLASLLVGSEGTLGVITSVWLRLTPAPEAVAPVVSLHDGTASGCAALARVLGSGLPVSALEYLDAETVRRAADAFPVPLERGGFMVLVDVDGSAEEVARLRAEVLEAVNEDALFTWAPESAGEIAALWRWRDGVSIAVQVERGGKASEDIVVPFDRLAEAIEETLAIGARHDLPACSWGHAGDGNLHSTFLVDPAEQAQLTRAEAAAEELFDLAVRLGGSVSGEHGLGLVKAGQLERQWPPGGARPARRDQDRLRSRGPAQPGQEALGAGDLRVEDRLALAAGAADLGGGARERLGDGGSRETVVLGDLLDLGDELVGRLHRARLAGARLDPEVDAEVVARDLGVEEQVPALGAARLAGLGGRAAVVVGAAAAAGEDEGKCDREQRSQLHARDYR